MPQPSRSDPPGGARTKPVRSRVALPTVLPTVLWATLLLGTALSSPAATAATSTADQVQAVERELNDWFKGLAGGIFKPGDYTIHLRPEGDDYALTAALGPNAAITGHLIRQDDGRWRLSDVKLPSPSTFTVSRPAPAQDGQPAPAIARTVEFSTARQETSGVLDPSYATPSSVQQRFETYQLAVKTESFLQLTQFARATNETTLTPVADKRLDVAYESALDGILLDQRRDSEQAFHLTVDRGHTTALLSGLSRERGPAFFHALATMIADRAGNKPQDILTSRAPFTADQRAQVRVLLDTLEGLASAVQTDVELNAVQVQSGKAQSSSVSAVMRRLRASVGGAVDNGVLSTYLDLGVEALSIPGLPVGPYADLVPTDIHLRPTLAGIGTKDLLTLAHQLLDATVQGEGTAPPDPAPLFAHGGIVAGLDAVSFNVGPTEFTGHGAVTITKPNTYDGQGQVAAIGFDALMDRAKRDPTLEKALALLTFAKGIGRTSGNQLVWDIAYQDRKLLVNGVDVMAMAAAAGGNGGGHARPMARPPAPAAPSPAPAPPSPSPSAKPPPE